MINFTSQYPETITSLIAQIDSCRPPKQKPGTLRVMTYKDLEEPQSASPGELLMVHLDLSMKDDQISDLIHSLNERAKLFANPGFYGACSSYDKDPRELWSIPEFISFVKRWVALGGLACMAINIPRREPAPGFDAMEFWLISQDTFVAGGVLIAPDMSERFVEALHVAAEMVERRTR